MVRDSAARRRDVTRSHGAKLPRASLCRVLLFHSRACHLSLVTQQRAGVAACPGDGHVSAPRRWPALSRYSTAKGWLSGSKRQQSCVEGTGWNQSGPDDLLVLY